MCANRRGGKARTNARTWTRARVLSVHGARAAWARPTRSNRRRIPFVQKNVEQNAPQRATEIVRKTRRHLAFGGHKRLRTISASQKPAAFALPGFCPRPRSSRANEFRSPHAARGLPSAASTADRNRALQASLQRAGRTKAASDPVPQRILAAGGPWWACAPLRGASGGDGAARGDALPSIAVDRRTRRAGKGKRSEEERRPQAFPPLQSPCAPCPEKSCRETSLALQAPLKGRASSQARTSSRRKGGRVGERSAPPHLTLGLRPERRGRRGRIVPMQPTGFFTRLLGATATWRPLLRRLKGFSGGVDTRFGASLVPALVPNVPKMKAGQTNSLPGLRFFWSQRADSNR